MSIITHIHQSKKNKFRTYAKSIDSAGFLDLLTHNELASIVANNLPHYRENTYTPTRTLSLFLGQSLNEDRSCNKAVNDLIIQQQRQNNTRKISANTGAYCLARKKIPLSLISQLTTKIAELVSQQAPEEWSWKGKRVHLIDGTTLTMPDTPENQQAFPQQGAQKPGLGFPICRVLAVSCLSSGVILNAAISPFKGKGSDEQSLLREVLETFKQGDLVVGDAFYGTYFLLVEMMKRGVDVLFEQMGSRKLSTDFGKGVALGKKDHLIAIPKSKRKPDWMTQNTFDELPKEIIIRECKVGKKILITTLLSAKMYPKKALQDVYKRRWNIEVDFRHMKTTLGMDILSCKTPEMCRKEIWVYFLANNLLRLFIAQSAIIYGLTPRQISFKHALQIWNTYTLLGQLIDANMLALMAKRTVGNRLGRIEPRALKRRPKAYPLLMKPRAEARLDILKNGHAKKKK